MAPGTAVHASEIAFHGADDVAGCATPVSTAAVGGGTGVPGSSLTAVQVPAGLRATVTMRPSSAMAPPGAVVST